MDQTIEVVTDVAAIGIFDPVSLKHRLAAKGPWWSKEAEALKELNKGNLIVVNVSSDGYYDLRIHDGEARKGEKSAKVKLDCPSGRLFFSGAEWITGEGLEPDAEHGTFIDVEPGAYTVTITQLDTFAFDVALKQTSGAATNDRKQMLVFL